MVSLFSNGFCGLSLSLSLLLLNLFLSLPILFLFRLYAFPAIFFLSHKTRTQNHFTLFIYLFIALRITTFHNKIAIAAATAAKLFITHEKCYVWDFKSAVPLKIALLIEIYAL